MYTLCLKESQRYGQIMTDDTKFPEQLGLLLVDDEEFNLKALKRLLHNQGFKVFTATSGQDALDVMNEYDIAIVVSDIQMPQMTGAELLALIWEKWPDTQRIVLTGYTDISETIDVVNQSNIMGYVRKPWDDEYFLSTVHKAAALYWGTVMDKFYEKDTAEKNKELRLHNQRLLHNFDQSQGQLKTLNEKLHHSYEDEKLLRQERREEQRISEAKSRFLATMSHEIRTPLNSIIATNTLMLETSLNQDQRELVKLSLNGSYSLLTLINDILDSSKINAGRLILHEAWFNLLEVVEETCDLLSGNLVDKSVDIISIVEPGTPCEVYGDKTRFVQILTNLLSNSVKFTMSGCITVRLSYDSKLNISVSDTGSGIPKDKLISIFDEFTQVDNSNTQTEGGTGLGLSISKKLCQLMGGEITVESELQEGTSFYVRIPFQMSNIIGFPQFTPARKNILLCSSNVDLYKSLKEQLRYFCCDLILDNSLNMELARKYDSVIYDMDSLCFVSRLVLNHENETLHVALISHDGVNQSERLKSHGFNSILRKPIRVSSLCKFLIYKMTTRPSEALLSSDQRRQIGKWLDDKVEDSYNGSAVYLDGISILLAEDSPSNQAVIKSILKGMKAMVDVAINGNEACLMADKKTYNIILMDVRMPGKDGLTATREILAASKFNRKTPIIALTANAYAEDQKACLDVGMVDFLSKPVNVSHFREVVYSWCSRDRLNIEPTVLDDEPHIEVHSSGSKLVDETTLRQLERDTSTEVLPEILGIFVEETKKRLEKILVHSDNKEWSAIENEAHTLKSSSGSFGAFPLQEVAKNIEEESRLKNSNNLKREIGKMRIICEETILNMEAKIEEKKKR